MRKALWRGAAVAALAGGTAVAFVPAAQAQPGCTAFPGAPCKFEGSGGNGGIWAMVTPDSTWSVVGTNGVSIKGNGFHYPSGFMVWAKGVTFTVTLVSGSGSVAAGELVPG